MTTGQNAPDVVIYADGASMRRANHRAGCGAVVVDATTANVLAYDCQPLGKMSKQAAEYEGLILGLQLAQSLGAESVHVRMDAELVIRQVTGEWQTKSPRMQVRLDVVGALSRAFAVVTYELIPAVDNYRADHLAGLAMVRQPAALPHDVGTVTTRQIAPAAVPVATIATSFAAESIGVKVDRTAALAARFGIRTPSEAASRLREIATNELATIWGSLPGERYLHEALISAPLSWKRGQACLRSAD